MSTESASIARAVLYPGVFDPMTLGHLDVMETAARLFPQIIIGIGENPKKTTLFSAEERKTLVSKSCRHIMNAEVVVFEGLIADYAKKHKISAFVRGLRTEADFVYEMQMAMMNKTLAPSVHTLLIPTQQMHSHISSTLVKEVAFLGGDISNLVPGVVKSALLQKTRQ